LLNINFAGLKPFLLASTTLQHVSLNVASSREFIDFLVENNVTAFGFDITVYPSEV